MAQRKRDERAVPGKRSEYRPPKVGAILLELRDALLRVQSCRRNLVNQHFSEQRWLEILNEVNPELRLMVRPQILDAVVVHLQRVGKPIHRKTLEGVLAEQGVGRLERIQRSISNSLRARKLIRLPDNTVGLPEWKTDKD